MSSRVRFAIVIVAATFAATITYVFWAVGLTAVLCGVGYELYDMLHRAGANCNRALYVRRAALVGLTSTLGSYAGVIAYYYATWVTITIVLAVYANDAGALFVGRKIGKRIVKRPLSKFSLNKSWEGAVGGVLVAQLVPLTLTAFGLLPDSLRWQYVTVVAVACIAAIVGDLLGSATKRAANVKDSSRSGWGGHGGWMDRFFATLSALVVTLPLVVWLF